MQETIDANSYISILKYSEYSENWCFQTLCSEITIYIFSRSLYGTLSLLWFSFFFVCNWYVWVAMPTRASRLTLATLVINYILLWQNIWSYNRDNIWIQGLKVWGLIISWCDKFPILSCIIKKSCNFCQLRKTIFSSLQVCGLYVSAKQVFEQFRESEIMPGV